MNERNQFVNQIIGKACKNYQDEQKKLSLNE